MQKYTITYRDGHRKQGQGNNSDRDDNSSMGNASDRKDEQGVGYDQR